MGAKHTKQFTKLRLFYMLNMSLSLSLPRKGGGLIQSPKPPPYPGSNAYVFTCISKTHLSRDVARNYHWGASRSKKWGGWNHPHNVRDPESTYKWPLDPQVDSGPLTLWGWGGTWGHILRSQYVQGRGRVKGRSLIMTLSKMLNFPITKWGCTCNPPPRVKTWRPRVACTQMSFKLNGALYFTWPRAQEINKMLEYLLRYFYRWRIFLWYA